MAWISSGVRSVRIPINSVLTCLSPRSVLLFTMPIRLMLSPSTKKARFADPGDEVLGDIKVDFFSPTLPSRLSSCSGNLTTAPYARGHATARQGGREEVDLYVTQDSSPGSGKPRFSSRATA